MMPNILKKFSFASLTAELIVIVIGVLIAIAIDTWLQNLEDAKLELEALSSLMIDLESAELLAVGMVRRDERIIDEATTVTENGALELGGRRISDILALFATVPGELRLRTYDELTESGDFRLITDRELRLLLTDFDSQARRLAGYDNQMETQWNVTSRPILYKVFQFELFKFSLNPRKHNDELIQPTTKELLEMYHAIVDRSNFAAVHLASVQFLLSLIEDLKNQTTIAQGLTP